MSTQRGEMRGGEDAEWHGGEGVDEMKDNCAIGYSRSAIGYG